MRQTRNVRQTDGERDMGRETQQAVDMSLEKDRRCETGASESDRIREKGDNRTL